MSRTTAGPLGAAGFAGFAGRGAGAVALGAGCFGAGGVPHAATATIAINRRTSRL